jgi:hypothetical protein
MRHKSNPPSASCESFCVDKSSLYGREDPAERRFWIPDIIQTSLQEPHGHDAVVLDQRPQQVVLLFPLKALVAGMMDGEVRLKEALPFPGVFRNCGFQSGDDVGLGSFIDLTARDIMRSDIH